MNVTIPGGGASKPGIFPPKVIRTTINLENHNRQQPYQKAWDHPLPRAQQVSRVYTHGAGIDFTV